MTEVFRICRGPQCLVTPFPDGQRRFLMTGTGECSRETFVYAESQLCGVKRVCIYYRVARRTSWIGQRWCLSFMHNTGNAVDIMEYSESLPTTLRTMLWFCRLLST